MKAPKAKVDERGFVIYMTRRMPVRLHREMLRLSSKLNMTMQGVMNTALELGLRYMLETHNLTPLPPGIERGIKWKHIPEGTGGEVHG